MMSPQRQKTIRNLTKLWVTAGLLIYSMITFRSIAQNRRATEEAMASMSQQQASQQLLMISLQISGFRRDRARLPRDLRELLKERSPNLSDAALLAPWGPPLRYEILEHQPTVFRLSSAGPDRVFDTEDDLQNPIDGKPGK